MAHIINVIAELTRCSDDTIKWIDTFETSQLKYETNVDYRQFVIKTRWDNYLIAQQLKMLATNMSNQTNVLVDQVEQFYTESVETVEIQDNNVYGPVHLAEVVVIGEKYDDSQQTIKITVEDEREYAAEMQPIPAPTAAFVVEEINPPSNICLT